MRWALASWYPHLIIQDGYDEFNVSDHHKPIGSAILTTNGSLLCVKQIDIPCKSNDYDLSTTQNRDHFV